MSESIYDAVVGVLTPLVGRPVAEICIRSSAMRIGKSSEALTTSDLDAVISEVKSSMGAFTSADMLDHAIDDIRSRTAA